MGEICAHNAVTGARWPRQLRHYGWSLLLLYALSILSLGWVLLAPERVLSSPAGDVASQFLYTRAFGFGEMAQGKLPLWNPYLYGGVPYLGDFQSALLYPPNLIFLVLPTGLAIGWSFLLHLFWLGAGMLLWACAGRGLSRTAGVVAAAAAMFGAPFFLHIHAGHLSNICTMAWLPWIFLALDRWLARQEWKWIVLGAGATALALYAGHPQYVLFAGLVTAIYALAHWPPSGRWGKTALGVLLWPVLAALLAAAQLLPGLEATAESIRGRPAPLWFTQSFSFPPENILTLWAPWLWGGLVEGGYMGRWLLWEMNVFAGLGVVLLSLGAVCGGVRDALAQKSAVGHPQPALCPTAHQGREWRLGLCWLAALLLALGVHTPLHAALVSVIPGFDALRGVSKFVIFCGLFLALLAGYGVDRLRNKANFAGFLWSSLGCGLLLACLAASLGAGILDSWLEAATHTWRETNQVLVAHPLTAPFELERMTRTAAKALSWAALGCALWAAGFWLLRAKPGLLSLFCAVAALEVFLFARPTTSSFPMQMEEIRRLREALRQIPGDFRVINLFHPNMVIALQREGIWGVEPSLLWRYDQLLRTVQRLPLEDPTGLFVYRFNHPVMEMLRAHVILEVKNSGVQISTRGQPFPRFFLAKHARVLPAEEILAELREPFFDLRHTVLLEEETHPRPDGSLQQSGATATAVSTDFLELSVFNDAPAILVIGDTYAKGWRVRSKAGSTQVRYDLVPANFALKGIPLAAGTHHLRIEYAPNSFRIGVWLTVLTLLLLGFLHWWSERKQPATSAEHAGHGVAEEPGA
jgi:hypothetical protein